MRIDKLLCDMNYGTRKQVKEHIKNGLVHVNGVAVVNREKCTSCGLCVKACPRKIIELVPYVSKYRVACSSADKGKDTKAVCSTGCIGCKICEKNCPKEAIEVTDNHAKILYDKCIGCGICANKCPVKIIKMQ